MIIRKAAIGEIEAVMQIYEQARIFMRLTNNGTQWGDSHPKRELIEADIEEGDLYVCVDEHTNPGEISGVFYYKVCDEPTYSRIEGGAWQNSGPYGVVHRLAGSRKAKGIGKFCLEWCEAQCGNIKIDTHRDNAVMLRVLEKAGYTYCGIIYVADGSERMAFQKIINPN
jgi:RimJ/RimL family protein N-acetyltransferase